MKENLKIELNILVMTHAPKRKVRRLNCEGGSSGKKRGNYIMITINRAETKQMPGFLPQVQMTTAEHVGNASLHK